MNFWIQEKKSKHIDLDLALLMYELDSERHDYIMITEESINQLRVDKDNLSYYKSIIPVGDLDFVQLVLSKFHDVHHMNPIEVPPVLRREIYLKRKYSIAPKEELPKRGYFFIKNASKLKDFSYTGMIEHIHEAEESAYTIYFKDKNLYQVSEVVEIFSEYRVFVHNDKITAIHYYDGDSKIFPDIQIISSMIDVYKSDKQRPKAYTMDVAVAKNKGTLLLEIHPWVSVGLYGYMFEESLSYCYRDGFQYYVDINREIETTAFRFEKGE